MRKTLWALSAVVAVCAAPPAVLAQFPGAGLPRQGRPGMPAGNAGFDPFARQRPDMLPGLGGFDPIPRSPRVPTPADIVNDAMNGSFRGTRPEMNQPWKPESVSLIPPKFEVPKVDPKPSFLTSSSLRWLRWLLPAILAVLGAVSRAARGRSSPKSTND
jgi:hypothetical protein